MSFRNKRNVFCVFLLSLVLSMQVLAQNTSLTFIEVGEHNRSSLKYSEATLLSVQLKRNNEILVGEEVSFSLLRADENGNFQPDNVELRFDFATIKSDGNGVALAKLSFNEAFYDDVHFKAAPEPGQKYQVLATFLGNLDASHSFCATDAEPSAAPNLHCPSISEYTLQLNYEKLDLIVEAGQSAGIGEDLTLVAQLKDPNGFAPKSGSAVTGDGEIGIEDLDVSFFFDLDGDLKPSLDEKIGTTKTNQDGIASLTFNILPDIFPAGVFEQGLHVQFGGNDHYDLASTSAAIIFEAGKADANKTRIESEKQELLANGSQTSEIIATLRDRSGHVLGLDAPKYDVHFESNLGFFQEKQAEYDALTGRYKQTFQSGDKAGTATITVFIEEVKGTTIDVNLLEDGGCSCKSGATHQSLLSFLTLFVVLFLVKKKHYFIV